MLDKKQIQKYRAMADNLHREAKLLEETAINGCDTRYVYSPVVAAMEEAAKALRDLVTPASETDPADAAPVTDKSRIVILMYADGTVSDVLDVHNYESKFPEALDAAFRGWQGSDNDLTYALETVLKNAGYEFDFVDPETFAVPEA